MYKHQQKIKKKVASNGTDGEDYMVQVKMILLFWGWGWEKIDQQSSTSLQRANCIMTTELLPLVYIYLY